MNQAVRGHGGQITLNGSVIEIRHEGVMATVLGVKGEPIRIPLNEVASIEYRPATMLLNGYVAVVPKGANSLRGIVQNGKNPYAVLFTYFQRKAFDTLKVKLLDEFEEAKRSIKTGNSLATSAVISPQLPAAKPTKNPSKNHAGNKTRQFHSVYAFIASSITTFLLWYFGNPYFVRWFDAGIPWWAYAIFWVIFAGILMQSLAKQKAVENIAYGEVQVRVRTTQSAFSHGFPIKEKATFYDVIGVGETASQDEITTKSVELGKEFLLASEQGDLRAAMRVKEIEAAFEVLGDPVKRKKYDEDLLASPPPFVAEARPTNRRPQKYRKLVLGLVAASVVVVIVKSLSRDEISNTSNQIPAKPVSVDNVSPVAVNVMVPIEYRGLTKGATLADVKKLFLKIKCKPALGLEFLDLSCEAGYPVIFGGDVYGSLEASFWKLDSTESLYALSFKVQSRYEDAVVKALEGKFGLPRKTGGESKIVMNVRFSEPIKYTWEGTDASISAEQESFTPVVEHVFIKYDWNFTEAERSFRRNIISEATQKKAAASPRPAVSKKDL